LLAVSIATAMRWYNTERIARWRRSRAFINANKHRHWASTCSDSVNWSSQCCFLAWCCVRDGAIF
jgi:trehalose-6-phosphate synthase